MLSMPAFPDAQPGGGGGLQSPTPVAFPLSSPKHAPIQICVQAVESLKGSGRSQLQAVLYHGEQAGRRVFQLEVLISKGSPVDAGHSSAISLLREKTEGGRKRGKGGEERKGKGRKEGREEGREAS